jgi:two-component system response regulator NreC
VADVTIEVRELRVANVPIRVVLADDRALLRGGLRILLEGEPDIEVVPGGGDVAAAARHVLGHRPDVLVLDLTVPDQPAIEAIGRLRASAPETQIVVLASDRDAASAAALFAAGAVGFVAKEVVNADLTPAVRAAAQGERFVSARVEAAMRTDGQLDTRGRLTARETEVLRLIAFGHTSVEIAGELLLSPRTVETHRARIHKKLALVSRAELVRYALRRGLLRS